MIVPTATLVGLRDNSSVGRDNLRDVTSGDGRRAATRLFYALATIPVMVQAVVHSMEEVL
ncbi:MAG: hypothetical protein EBZ29_02150 [Synechococcaceae bacterium WB9_4xC_028]|nr:hypothetical protein [Synechococcaceae bacterium WB9_4xB_025]NDD68214.1 hypothetical protein [Synechococcaceae bacterium WB9_4xC_028]TCD58730.1 hypothetical protein CWE17_06610 [Synechococcus sp. BS56D]